MTDETFWLTIWKIVAIAACVIVVSIASCTVHSDYRISKDIEHGANPIAAQCAHSASGVNSAACGAVAVSR